jgi:hypothetical protein
LVAEFLQQREKAPGGWGSGGGRRSAGDLGSSPLQPATAIGQRPLQQVENRQFSGPFL